MKDPIEELIEQADESEAEKPWNKWPNLWFVAFEVLALILVVWAFRYFEVYEMLCIFTCSE